MKEIIFKIDKNGHLQYETSGYQGDACLDAARALLQELTEMGIDVTLEGVQRKPDAYEDVEVGDTTQQEALS